MLDKTAARYYREDYSDSFADSDRYITDRYDLKLSIVGTKFGYSVSCQVYSIQIGLASYMQYWHYKDSELNEAKKTFSKIKSFTEQIRKYLEFNRHPMVSVLSQFKSHMSPIDIRHQERTGITSVNQAKFLPVADDYRVTLYGNRYPENDIGPLYSEPINEPNKSVEVSNKNSRDQQYSYKYASTQAWTYQFAGNEYIEKIFANKPKISYAQMTDGDMADRISQGWKVSLPIAKNFLIWFLSIGGTQELLNQSLAQGISPQQAVAKVQPNEKPKTPPAPPVEQTPADPNSKVVQIDTSNLNGLKPEFRVKVENVLRKLQAKGWQPKVAEGLRTVEQQKEKVQKGFSKTLKSKHLDGLAADIIDKRYGWGKEAANLDFQFWKDLGQAATEESLTWGGNFKNFPDVAHVEFITPKVTNAPTTKAPNKTPAGTIPAKSKTK